jgi:hypothetical protein
MRQALDQSIKKTATNSFAVILMMDIELKFNCGPRATITLATKPIGICLSEAKTHDCLKFR